VAPGASPPAGSARTTAATPSQDAAADDRERVRHVALERVIPCSLQPRKEFSPEALQELADSIKEQGIIQPLIVRQRDQSFELIAGERRWRASQMVGLKEVPVIVRTADDRTVLELALIENLQRENLNPLEEAHGYSELIEQFNLRQEDVAGKVGKSRAVVANSLRLLKLPLQVQHHLRGGLLSVGHAKVILGLANPEEQKLAADRIVKDGLNVRQTEDLVSRLQHQPVPRVSGAKPSTRDPNLAQVEDRLRERFGTKVQLRYRQGKGAVEIRFFSDDELERILQIVGVTID